MRFIFRCSFLGIGLYSGYIAWELYNADRTDDMVFYIGVAVISLIFVLALKPKKNKAGASERELAFYGGLAERLSHTYDDAETMNEYYRQRMAEDEQMYANINREKAKREMQRKKERSRKEAEREQREREKNAKLAEYHRRDYEQRLKNDPKAKNYKTRDAEYNKNYFGRKSK